MTKRPFLLGLACLLLLIASGSTRAEVPRNPPPPGDTLQAVLDRIRTHAAIEAWKEPGWKDDAIEAWLDKLVGSVAKAADFPDLKLPVRLADVKPAEPMARMLSGTLIVGQNVDLKNMPLRNSIVLADGNVELGGADGCVIVCRGTVTVRSISQRSVIAAGTLVKLNLDGRPGTNDSGSLVVSRGWVDMGRSSYGTMVAAHEGINASRFQSAIFINAPVPPARIDPRGGNGSRSLAVNDLPLERLRIHSLSDKLTLLGVLHGALDEAAGFGGVPLPGRETFGPTGIVFRFDGRKYVAEIGKPIENEAGQLVEPLRPWKVAHVMGSLAILSGSDADIIVRMGDK